jgi:methionyl-tRNA formyltransferase
MRVAFAGTPDFAKVALAQLIKAGHELCLVLSQPDRPAGRGMRPQISAVKACAVQQGLSVLQPHSLRLDGRFAQDAQAAQQALLRARPEVMVVAAYGLLLPQWVLALPQRGCLNIHASLLPRWRGAAPIHRAIEAGDAHTGITIMQMDEGLDTGDILQMQSMAIEPQDNTQSLHDKLAPLGAQLLLDTLKKFANNTLPTRQTQPSQGICYAHKIDKTQAKINWALPAQHIERQLRAFDPTPGAYSTWLGEPLKIWRGQLANDVTAAPGTVVAVSAQQGILVACGGQTALWVTLLQRAGGKRLNAPAFLAGHPLQVGQCLGSNHDTTA